MNRNTNLVLTVEAWKDIAEMRVDVKIDKHHIGWNFALERSIRSSMEVDGQMPTSVTFEFLYYGRFVDMGVYRGVFLSDVPHHKKEVRSGLSGSNRVAKPFWSRTFYAEVKKLTEILAKKYGLMGCMAIQEGLLSEMDGDVTIGRVREIDF